MTLYSWSNAPTDVRTEIAHLTDSLEQILPDGLIGVYLHGSLAMGCFNPPQSDIDLLVVVKAESPVEVKRSLALHLLDISTNPSAVEISLLTRR